MSSLAEIFASIALVLPVAGMGSSASNEQLDGKSPESEIGLTAQQASEDPPRSHRDDTDSAKGTLSVQWLLEERGANQIRVRQRVFVRITPSQSGVNRQNLVARPPQSRVQTRYKEDKPNSCVPVKRISSVQTGSGNRLILLMKDSKVMSLNLEKACRSRDFYAGFYVDKNKDGKMCVDRDMLQSRNGAKCSIERMMQLVKIDD